jgi:hypothetical protein
VSHQPVCCISVFLHSSLLTQRANRALSQCSETFQLCPLLLVQSITCQIQCSHGRWISLQGCWCFRFHDSSDAEQLRLQATRAAQLLQTQAAQAANIRAAPQTHAQASMRDDVLHAGSVWQAGGHPVNKAAVRDSVARILCDPSFQGTMPLVMCMDHVCHATTLACGHFGAACVVCQAADNRTLTRYICDKF